MWACRGSAFYALVARVGKRLGDLAVKYRMLPSHVMGVRIHPNSSVHKFSVHADAYLHLNLEEPLIASLR